MNEDKKTKDPSRPPRPWMVDTRNQQATRSEMSTTGQGPETPHGHLAHASSAETPTNSWRREQQRINLGEHARAYIRKGWHVVPLWWPQYPGVCACRLKDKCKSIGKHPMRTGWTTDVFKDNLSVELWWDKHPLANVGIVTGAGSGIIALDIDPRHQGWDSYHKIVKKYGALPSTPVSITGSGGWHVLFRHPRCRDRLLRNAAGYLQGIDIRSDGGQIVAPPSLHGSGARYAWHPDAHPLDTPLASIPDWIFHLIEIKDQMQAKQNRKISHALKGMVDSSPGGHARVLNLTDVAPIIEGHRNEQLIRFVGRLFRANKTEMEVMEIAHQINMQRCTPPLPEHEVNQMVRNAARRWA